jgi:hypothetical protein
MLQASSAASLFNTSQTSRLTLFDLVTATLTHKAMTNAARKERIFVALEGRVGGCKCDGRFEKKEK